MSRTGIKVHGVNYQRNGVSGLGFYVVGFEMTDDNDKLRQMAGWVFTPYIMAYGVIDLAEPWLSWRGDHFFEEMCKAIEAAQIDGSHVALRLDSWGNKVTPGAPRPPEPTSDYGLTDEENDMAEIAYFDIESDIGHEPSDAEFAAALAERSREARKSGQADDADMLGAIAGKVFAASLRLDGPRP